MKLKFFQLAVFSSPSSTSSCLLLPPSPLPLPFPSPSPPPLPSHPLLAFDVVLAISPRWTFSSQSPCLSLPNSEMCIHAPQHLETRFVLQSKKNSFQCTLLTVMKTCNTVSMNFVIFLSCWLELHFFFKKNQAEFWLWTKAEVLKISEIALYMLLPFASYICAKPHLQHWQL